MAEMYEIRQTEDKGLGVFAVKKIHRGIPIIAEKPVVFAPAESLDLVSIYQ